MPGIFRVLAVLHKSFRGLGHDARMPNWLKVLRKPDIPPCWTRFFEQRGPEGLRTLLYDGWSIPDGLTEKQKDLRVDSEQRKHALKWLQWKAAVNTAWMKIGVGAAVVAALASIVAAIRG